MSELEEARDFLLTTVFGKEVNNTLTAFDMYKLLLDYRKVVVKNLTIPVVVQQRELLKGDYRQHFIDWKTKYFDYKPKIYEYRSKDRKREYTLNGLHKMYKRAMLQSPFNCG